MRAIEAKKGLPRCSRCREFLGPADAVCGNCGQAYTPFIRVRAEKLGLSPRVCHHNFMESETGYTCVRCGLQMLAGGVRDISRLSTRVGTLCGCCGSRLRGKMFCTTCGARVGLWTVKPKLDDARAFRLFTQHAAYLERQDPNYRFKVHSSRPLNWAAALLIILAMVVAVMGVIYLASHYLWLQRSLAHVNEQYPDRSVEAAALDHFIAQGCNPVGMSSLRSDTLNVDVGRLIEDSCLQRARDVLAGTDWLSTNLPPQVINSVLSQFVTLAEEEHADVNFAYLDLYWKNPIVYGELMKSATSSAERKLVEELPAIVTERESARSRLYSQYLKAMLLTLIPVTVLILTIMLLMVRLARRGYFTDIQRKAKRSKKAGIIFTSHRGDARAPAFMPDPRRARSNFTFFFVLAMELAVLGSICTGYYSFQVKPKLTMVKDQYDSYAALLRQENGAISPKEMKKYNTEYRASRDIALWLYLWQGSLKYALLIISLVVAVLSILLIQSARRWASSKTVALTTGTETRRWE